MLLKHNNLCKLNIFHGEVVCPREKMVWGLLRIHHASYSAARKG